METVGFRGDRDAKIIIDKYIDSFNATSELKLDKFYKEKLIAYLANGTSIFSITLWMYDGDNSIGPYMIYTDGVWIWPSHLAYYIEQGDYRYLKTEFLNFIEHNDFKVADVPDEIRKQATQFLEGILNVKKR